MRFVTAVLAGGLLISAAAGFSGCKPKETGALQMEVLSDLTAEAYYQNGYTNNSIVGVDQFGRAFEAVSGEKEGQRDVGMFYFCTLGQHGATDIYDVSKILEMENGRELMFFTDNEVAPAGKSYFWGEPLFGYYNSADRWVIRRHLSLLAMAGVDFLVFDVTNAFTYDTVVGRIISEAQTMIEAGWDVPGLAFYTNANSVKVTTDLYNRYYKRSKFDNVWYYLDGKPLIIAEGSKTYSDEIWDRFTFRLPQWPSESFKENGFPWVEWQYPAPVHDGVINVAVASHPALPMSFSVTRGAKNWGRGWNVETQKNESDRAYEGTFFQSTWDVAIKEDPRIVFVLGWNEWTAGKNMYDGEYALVDCATMEFSRDAEMMKGGYNDAFYIQLASNIRRYKSLSLKGNQQLAGTDLTMPMDGDLSGWDSVPAVFREIAETNEARDCQGAAPSVYYEQAAARNNVVEVRVCKDAENFYFYLRATEEITAREDGDGGWMNLFIGTGAVSMKGWESYEYVINRAVVADGICTVEKLNGDFTSEKVGEAEIAVYGTVMLLKIPRAAIGLTGENHSLYFKVADAIEQPSDIMDYYVSGKSLPLGRLSFRYLG